MPAEQILGGHLLVMKNTRDTLAHASEGARERQRGVFGQKLASAGQVVIATRIPELGPDDFVISPIVIHSGSFGRYCSRQVPRIPPPLWDKMRFWEREHLGFVSE